MWWVFVVYLLLSSHPHHPIYLSPWWCGCGKTRDKQPTHTDRREPTAGKSHHGPKAGSCVRRKPNLSEASVRLGHKSLRTLMKRSSSWYLPGGYQGPLHPSSSQSLRPNGSCFPRGQSDELVFIVCLPCVSLKKGLIKKDTHERLVTIKKRPVHKR